MDIIYLDKVDSTHNYLKKYITSNGYSKPICIVTQNQTNGIGSRENSWQGLKGNLFFSFVIAKNLLPDDLPIQSSSIYFSFILKEILNSFGSQVWLKWPNDFYIKNKKIGGTITNLRKDLFFCGIGINLKYVDEQYGFLDIDINVKEILNKFNSNILDNIKWKHIFSKYSIEFEKSKIYKTTINTYKTSLENSILNSDGSISINNQKVFSLR
ncbi:MAG: biotin--[acetyl-CoA-carboxylase] ligase [Campylobacterota bacterium]|nr:biotin--[acetyl-CoA-carboxylase] ligase [Campylobacterota bacterium]